MPRTTARVNLFEDDLQEPTLLVVATTENPFFELNGPRAAALRCSASSPSTPTYYAPSCNVACGPRAPRSIEPAAEAVLEIVDGDRRPLLSTLEVRTTNRGR
jgi:replication-associated recombination protein RarA